MLGLIFTEEELKIIPLKYVKQAQSLAAAYDSAIEGVHLQYKDKMDFFIERMKEEMTNEEAS